MFIHGHCEGGCLGSAKKFKTSFFKDIENSFHEVTHIGLGQFRPQLWTSLATIFVEIFQKEKNW